MSQYKVFKCLSVVLFVCSTSFGQKAVTCYVDSSLKLLPKGADDYAYKCKLARKDSIFNLDCFDRETKDIRISAQFSDSLLIKLHGNYTSYYSSGSVASKRQYSNGEKSGVWQSWDKEGNRTDSSNYVHNERTSFALYGYNKSPGAKPVLTFHQYTDSLKNTFQQELYTTDGKLLSEAFFVGERGVEKTYENVKVTTDSVFTREQKEAEFPGGNRSWARYVQKSLVDFNAGANGAGNGVYPVIIRFQISEDGSITEVLPETNYGYGMEATAVEIVKNGSKWTPAKRFGRPAKAYRRQPFTFVVEGK